MGPRKKYWNSIENLDNTPLGFGMLRGEGNRIRQKAVDSLIAVHILVGAFTRTYSIAVLIAGDADFVPIVREGHGVEPKRKST